MLESQRISLFTALIDYFKNFYPISDAFIKEIEQHALPLVVKKNKYILSPIDKNAHIFFIVKGIVRGFIKDEHKEITTWISFGNEFVGAIKHPLQKYNSSIEYLQALEETELIAVSNTLIDTLYVTYPETNIISRKILAKQYHAALERSILARIPSAERRYEEFMKKNTSNVLKVPLRCIASYLGMRLETLSRIRNKLAKARVLV